MSAAQDFMNENTIMHYENINIVLTVPIGLKPLTFVTSTVRDNTKYTY